METKTSDNIRPADVHLIGNAHLDPVWLWRWPEGCGEVLQTFRSALDRLNEYDGFIFTCSSAAYYRWVEEIDPAMFEEIRARVKEGRIVPVGGWWVQPDCNMPSGESFARQALYSQRYYMEKFGITCKTGYNVDSFGHCANLPQLLRNGGMDAYVMMRPYTKENPDIPQCFDWEGIDGTVMPTFRILTTYNTGQGGAGDIADRLEESEQITRETDRGMMLFYGVGNHGGGPTRGDIEFLRERLVREGHPALRFSSPDAFFADLRARLARGEQAPLPRWSDDLQHHASGCYSATSAVKTLNRQAENALYRAEAFATLARKRTGMADKTALLGEAWREVSFHQFHDILCGCCIMEAYEDVKHALGGVIHTAQKIETEALLRLAGQIDTWVDGVSVPYRTVRNRDFELVDRRPVVVFNPLPFPVETPVTTYLPSGEVRDSDGNTAVAQNVRSSRSNDSHLDTCFIAKVPTLGYATYWLHRYDKDTPTVSAQSDIAADGLSMENAHLAVTVDGTTGAITRLLDKHSGFDYAAETPLAVPTVQKDEKTDTWAHNVFRFDGEPVPMTLESATLVERGPVRAVIRTRHTFGGSWLVQDFILGAGQNTLRVEAKAMWQENYTILKLNFPVIGENPENTYAIPGGMLRRPVNGEEEPAGPFAAVGFDRDGTRRTLAVLNDSKYSYDCVPLNAECRMPNAVLRLTAIRNVLFADHYSYRPAANFNFCDEGLQRFVYGIFVADGDPAETAVAREADLLNQPLIPVPEGFHHGDAAPVAGFFTADKENIRLTALKSCEDGSGDTVLRLYETSGRPVTARVTCPTAGADFTADFGRFEVKTFRVSSDGKVRETDFLEGTV